MKARLLNSLKNTLKPTKVSIIIFIIIVLLISFLVPLYPVSISYAKYDRFDTVSRFISGKSYTGYQPLAVVLMGDFNWIFTEYTGPDMSGPGIYTIPSHSIVESWTCSANPIFILVFIPIFILAYIVSSFLALYLKYKLVKGVKDMGD